MSFTAKARTLGIIGHPVGHSLSPLLHNYWIEESGQDAVYVPLPVQPGTLRYALAGLKTLGFLGANVTIPYKEEALELLDKLDLSARVLGAVNTLKVIDNVIVGYNTDARGFVRHLETTIPDWKANMAGGPALILGAGGAARAVISGLIGAGCRRIVIANRTYKSATDIASFFSKEAMIEAVPWNERATVVTSAFLIVNTTSLGMVGCPPLEIDLGRCASTTIAYDIVYVPEETVFLGCAEQRGLRTVGGLGMLIEQARAAFQIWFGKLPRVTENQLSELRSALAAK